MDNNEGKFCLVAKSGRPLLAGLTFKCSLRFLGFGSCHFSDCGIFFKKDHCLQIVRKIVILVVNNLLTMRKTDAAQIFFLFLRKVRSTETPKYDNPRI